MSLTEENNTQNTSIGSISIQAEEKQLPKFHHDPSTFSKFLGLYTRSENGLLYCIEEKRKFKIHNHWKQFYQAFKLKENQKSQISSDISQYIIEEDEVRKYYNNLALPVKVSEYKRPGEEQIRGCITVIDDENKFNDWFIFHILDQARLEPDSKPYHKSDIKYDELFCDYFEENLKNTVIGDKWTEGGRDHFIKKVRYFTDRYIKIECVLPAFPCKSSNNEKVCGIIPDKGEELALKRLIEATFEVQKFYKPGMKIWIISDGHVFSDCIGVDDTIVDDYTKKLHQLYENVAIPGHDAIGFCGLKELFFEGETFPKFDKSWVSDIEVEHYTGSNICEISDLSRQVLLKGCDTDAGKLKEEINTPNHPRLYLFRGFSKFMTEDLRLLPYFKDMSRKKFKKIVSKIAFNMIKRNDAYSNLVELVFPHHMRLSIHAHTNSGPKFGIKVISPKQCRMVKSLEESTEPKSEDLLHIPTPWHNVVVHLVDSSESYYLTKAIVVKDALEEGSYKGVWVDTCLEKGEGGFYQLTKDPNKAMA